MNEKIAKHTNLIPDKENPNHINDIDVHILKELLDFMKLSDDIEGNLFAIVSSHLDRKLIKAIFMPIIYGKSLMSTANDIKEKLSQYITRKESYTLAKVCFEFWNKEYRGLVCLIRLIKSSIGWLASAGGRPVIYQSDYFTTVQDYMKMDPVNIWVYDRIHKKRRKVTLRVSSNERDKQKSAISTETKTVKKMTPETDEKEPP